MERTGCPHRRPAGLCRRRSCADALVGRKFRRRKCRPVMQPASLKLRLSRAGWPRFARSGCPFRNRPWEPFGPFMKRASARNCWPASWRSNSKPARKSKRAMSCSAWTIRICGPNSSRPRRRFRRRRPSIAKRPATRNAMRNWSVDRAVSRQMYEQVDRHAAVGGGRPSPYRGGRQGSAGHAGLGHHPVTHRWNGHRQKGRCRRHGHAGPNARHALRSETHATCSQCA